MTPQELVDLIKVEMPINTAEEMGERLYVCSNNLLLAIEQGKIGFVEDGTEANTKMYLMSLLAAAQVLITKPPIKTDRVH